MGSSVSGGTGPATGAAAACGSADRWTAIGACSGRVSSGGPSAPGRGRGRAAAGNADSVCTLRGSAALLSPAAGSAGPAASVALRWAVVNPEPEVSEALG
jgi:hypothetical protein